MTEQKQIPDLSGVLPLIDESYEQILLSIQDDYKICKAAGKKLYHHLWIYTHGIATLCATKMCRFTDEEISTMITEVCMSILKKLRSFNTCPSFIFSCIPIALLRANKY